MFLKIKTRFNEIRLSIQNLPTIIKKVYIYEQTTTIILYVYRIQLSNYLEIKYNENVEFQYKIVIFLFFFLEILACGIQAILQV